MPASRRGRSLAVWATAFALFAATGVATAPKLAELALRSALRARGVAAELRVREIGLLGAEIESLTLGAPAAEARAGSAPSAPQAAPALRVDALTLVWSPRGLLGRRVERVRARGVWVRGEWLEAGAPRFRALEPLLAAEGGPLPRVLDVRELRIELALPSGTLTIRGNARAASDGARWSSAEAALVLEGEGANGNLRASWQAGRAAELRGSLAAPGSLATPLGALDGVQLELSLRATAAPSSDAVADARSWRGALRGDAQARLTARGWRGEATRAARAIALEGSARSAPDGSWHLDASLSAEIGEQSANLSAAFALAPWDGDAFLRPPLPAELRVQLESPTAALGAVELEGELELTWDGEEIRAELRAPARLELAPQTTHGRALGLAAPFRAQMPALSLALERATGAVRAAAEIAPTPLALASEAKLIAHGTAPRLTLALRAGTRSVLGWSARGGTLALPSASLHLEALGASGEIALMPEPATGPIEVTRLAVRDDAAAPRFGPLVLSGRVSGLASKLAARGALRLRDGGPEVAFAFEEHEGAERFDSMAFSLGPAAFDAGSRDLLRLVPPLAAAFDVAGGTLAWRGELELPRGAEPRVRSHVSLADAVLATGALRVEGIAGSLGLASLTPLEISPSAIRFARAHVGPELSAGAAQLELAGDALRLRDLSARALGGTLSGDVSLPLASANGEAALRFEAISLESLARLLEIEALRAEGEISGALDAAFGAQGFSLRKGSLASVRPGTLRYRPELPPAALASAGGDTNVLLAALSDFRFERMRADVALAPEGVVAQLALDGRNPALQRGRPIELRARIAAPLPELLALRDAWQRLVRALSRAR